MALVHPGGDVAAARDFPIVDMRRVAEGIELMADPFRPFAVAARVADENIGHTTLPWRPILRSKSIFVVAYANCNRPQHVARSVISGERPLHILPTLMPAAARKGYRCHRWNAPS